jgi:hypothetical protein
LSFGQSNDSLLDDIVTFNDFVHLDSVKESNSDNVTTISFYSTVWMFSKVIDIEISLTDTLIRKEDLFFYITWRRIKRFIKKSLLIHLYLKIILIK